MKNTARQRRQRRRRSSSTLRSGWELDNGSGHPHHLVPRRRVVHPAGRSGGYRVAHVSSARSGASTQPFPIASFRT